MVSITVVDHGFTQVPHHNHPPAVLQIRQRLLQSQHGPLERLQTNDAILADVCRESFEPKPRNAGAPERTIITVGSCPQLGRSIRKARAVDNNQDLLAADGTTVGIVGAWWNGGQAHVWKPTYRSRTGIDAEWRGAGSLHPGGAQFTMADASVRFIAETIQASNMDSGQANNNNIWNALNTAAGSGGQGSFELIPTLD